MKKVLKSRIFFVLITTIIVGSIGVFAGTKLNASDIKYTDKNNNETTVDSALNDLYTEIGNKNCVYGEFVCDSECVSENGKLLEENFTARKAIIWSYQYKGSIGIILIYDKDYDENIYRLLATDVNNANRPISNTVFINTNNNFYLHLGSDNLNAPYYYYACK